MSGVDELLKRVKTRARGLPPPEERKAIREEAGVSIREMARALDVSHTAITRWEAGGTPRRRNGITDYQRLLAGLKDINLRYPSDRLPTIHPANVPRTD